MLCASLLVTVLACCLLKRLLPPLARLPVQLQPMEMRVWGWDIMGFIMDRARFWVVTAARELSF